MRLFEDNLTEMQQKFIDDFSIAYSNKFESSKKWIQEKRFVYCDWMNALTFKKSIKELIFPIFSKRSKGAHFEDIDGNLLTDIAMGYGVNFWGHNPDFVKKAISERLELGVELGPQLKLSAEVAELISELTGVERVAFCNSGTEAVMTAIRIARGKTGKNKIVIFKGSYHGTFDGVLGVGNFNSVKPISIGTPDNFVKDLYVLDYGASESLEFIKKNIKEIAAVIVEPVQSRNPALRPKEFLHNLREITSTTYTALIFDETITGFRISPGGAQKYFDVMADLVVYGKALGGGMPISAVAGKDEYMQLLDGGMWQFGDDSMPHDNVIFHAGTYYKHPLSIAAAKASLTEIKKRKNSIYEEMRANMAYLAESLNGYFKGKN
ncbi:MAG: aminotransferase class III-fold pyridoxal phosphate-dependent enzyme, partial [Deferribacterales bacterium]|nr:aminotransferase class III-fold pyridoxal phosphate-dependent enzyme [Deferribacterales bacterium]